VKEEPIGIAVGPDGNIWYTEGVINANGTGYDSTGVGVIDANAKTLLKEIPVSANSEPYSIASGPDGNLWVAVPGTTVGGSIVVISPSTKTIAQTLSIPTNVASIPSPAGITVGPDGNIWFADAGGAIGVVTLSTPTPPTITSEAVATYRQHNKRGKPLGKPLISFVFQFSTAMDPASAGNPNNFQVASTTLKRVKKKVVQLFHPVGVVATYNASNHSVTLVTSATKKTFAKGGEITVIASPPGGITGASGLFLDGKNDGVAGDNGVFSILANASSITHD
jgi:streptogramin lyase